MAIKDKTYVNREQYNMFKKWMNSSVKKQMKRDLTYIIHHYEWEDGDFRNGDHDLPLWNTSSLSDLWLSKNCPLPFVQERLREQYPENWIGFLFKEEIDFSSAGSIFLIANEKNTVSVKTYKVISEDESGTDVELYDTILLYGNTEFYKFLNDAISVTCGEYYNILNEDIIVAYKMFGINITYENGKYYDEDSREINVGYYPLGLDGIKDRKFKKIMKLPNIKHSWVKKDIEKYELEQIVISSGDEICNITDYSDITESNKRRLFNQIPSYISLMLK